MILVSSRYTRQKTTNQPTTISNSPIQITRISRTATRGRILIIFSRIFSKISAKVATKMDRFTISHHNRGLAVASHTVAIFPKTRTITMVAKTTTITIILLQIYSKALET